MKRSIRTLFLVAMWWACSTLTYASEIRVLLKFDSSGHQVVRLIRNDDGAALPAPVSDTHAEDKPQSLESLMAALRPRIATVVWRDSDGTLLSSSQEPDPRISSTPAHVEGRHGSMVGLQEGAWLISGPDWASGLTILLPADVSLGLGFEQWDLLLDVNH